MNIVTAGYLFPGWECFVPKLTGTWYLSAHILKLEKT